MFTSHRSITRPEPSPEKPHGRYLTDGVHLYRRLDELCGRGMVSLVDCRSLGLVVVSTDAARRLRPVRAPAR